MTTRLGIVGFGTLVQGHLLPAIRASGRFQVVAVAEPRDGAAEEILRLDPEILHVADYRRLEAAELDAVVVAVPNFLHGEVASHFLERSLHVFCEKPLGISSQQCRAMVDLARRREVQLMVGHVLRFAPAARLARELVRSDLFGAFRYLSCNQGTARPIGSFSGFYARKEECGGGVLMDKGVHVLDLLEFLLGEIEITAARLVATDGLGPGLEDEVTLELRAAGSEVRSVYSVSRVRKLDGRLTLVFERGNLHLSVKDPSRLTFSLPYGTGGRRDAARLALPPNEMFSEEMRHLADVVEHGVACEADGTAGLRVVTHVEKAYELLGLVG